MVRYIVGSGDEVKPSAASVNREVIPVLLVALSLAGFVIAAGHGPNIVPVVWLGLAAWVLVRRLPITASPGPGELGREIEGSS